MIKMLRIYILLIKIEINYEVTSEHCSAGSLLIYLKHSIYSFNLTISYNLNYKPTYIINLHNMCFMLHYYVQKVKQQTYVRLCRHVSRLFPDD